MTMFDVINIGIQLNEQASAVIPQTQDDLTCNIFQLLRTVVRAGPSVFPSTTEKRIVQDLICENNLVKARTLMSLICARRVANTVSNNQKRKYCIIVCGLWKYKMHWKDLMSLIKDVNNLEVSSNQSLWDCTTLTEQLFVLKMVSLLFPVVRGSVFDSNGKRVTVTLKESMLSNKSKILWRKLGSLAKKHKVSANDLGGKEIIQGGNREGALLVSTKVISWMTKLSPEVLVVDEVQHFSNVLSPLLTFLETHTEWVRSDPAHSVAQPKKPSTPDHTDNKVAEKDNSTDSEEDDSSSSSSGSDSEPAHSPTSNKEGTKGLRLELLDNQSTKSASKFRSDARSSEVDDVLEDQPLDENLPGASQSGCGETATNPLVKNDKNLILPKSTRHSRKESEGVDIDPSLNEKCVITPKVPSFGNSPEPMVPRDDAAVSSPAPRPERNAKLLARKKCSMSLAITDSENESEGEGTKKTKIIRPREDEKNSVNESSDKYGFRITHRWSGAGSGISWQTPSVRKGGFINVRKRDGLYSGLMITASKRTKVNLMEDYVTPWTTMVGKDWKLDEEPDLGDEELHFKNRFWERGVEGSMSMSAQKILRTLGFRPPHSALFLLSYYDILRLRAFTHSRICHEFPAFGKFLLGSLQGSSAQRELEAKDSVKELVVNTIRMRRKLLDTNGFVVFPGIFDRIESEESNASSSDAWVQYFDRYLPSGVEGIGKVLTEVNSLFNFMCGSLPSAAELESNNIPRAKKVAFASIRDNAGNPSGKLSKSSRITSVRGRMNEFLGEGADARKIQLLKVRASIEVVVMQMAAMLRLDYQSFEGPESEFHPKLYVPDSGSRFLATAPNCETQVPHLDYFHVKGLQSADAPRSIAGGCALPAYFAIVTGSSFYPIWVLPGSQKYVFLSEPKLKDVSELEKLRLLYVPPHSILLVRGDVIHCGAGSLECSGNFCERLHLYIGRETISIPDAINEHIQFDIMEEDKTRDWKQLIVRF